MGDYSNIGTAVVTTFIALAVIVGVESLLLLFFILNWVFS